MYAFKRPKAMDEQVTGHVTSEACENDYMNK